MSEFGTYPTTMAERDCINCGTEDSFVDPHGNGKICTECYYTPNGSHKTTTVDDEFSEFWDHRAANYDGFYGSERAKHVGGFVSAYDFDELRK